MKTIVITAGHGGPDPGACHNGWVEADITTSMRNAVACYLKAYAANMGGVQVLTDGEASTNLPLKEAISLARKGDIAVELHLNAGPESVTGCEVLSSPRNKQLSQKVAQAIVGVTGSRLRGDRGWKSQHSGAHSRLGYISSGGGIIVEVDFITNDEMMVWLSKKYWYVAKAIAQAIIEQLGSDDVV